MEMNSEENIRFLEQTFGVSPNNVVIIDPGTMKIVYANQTALDAFGYTREELVGKTAGDINAFFTNETIKVAFESIINSNNQHGTIPTEYKRKDGSRFEVEVFLSGFKWAAATYMLVSASKISVLKKAEDQLQFHATLFNSISDAVISMDNQFTVTSCNKYAQQMFGWKEEEAIGKNSQDLAPTLYPFSSQADVLEQLATNGSWQGEIITHRKSGEAFPAVASTGVVKDSKGKTTGFVTVIRDITETKRIETELKNLNDQLEQRVQQKTDELTQVLDRISDAFTAYDKDWNYIYVNKKAGEFIGRDPKKLIGKNLYDVFPEGNQSPLFKGYQEAMLEQKPRRREVFIDKHKKWFEGTAYPSPDGLSVYFRDITDLKKSALAIEESELMYRTIVESAHEGIWQVDEHFNTIFINDFIGSLLGYEKEEIIGKKPFEFIAEDERQKAANLLENLKIHKGGQQAEGCFIRKDKTKVACLIQSNPLFKGNEFVGALTMVLDISEKKKAEAELVAREKRYSALYENSHDGTTLLSQDAVILEISPQVERITGLVKEELLNRKVYDFLLPDEVPVFQSAMQHILHHPASPKTIQYRYWSSDGSISWLECTLSNLLHEPAVNAIVGNFRNITDQKNAEFKIVQSEARYRKAQLQGRLGHWSRTLSDNKIAWSDEIPRILGLEVNLSDLDYNTFLSVVHPEDKELAIRENAMAVEGVKSLDYIHRVVLPDGSIKYVHEVAEVIKDENGRPVELTGMMQDITEQQLAQQALLLSEKNYRLLFEENPNPLWMADTEGLHFIEVNDAALSLYGYTREEFLNMQVSDIRIADGANRLAGMWYEDEVFNETIKHKKKNGEVIYVTVEVNWIAYNGKNFFLCSGRDITMELLYEKKLKESQQQLSLIFNSSVDSMWLLKVEKNHLYRFEAVNEAFLILNNLDKKAVIGYLISDVFTKSWFEEINERYKECVNTGVIKNFVIQSPVSLWRRISDLTFIPIKNENGKVIQVLGISRDITAQKDAEEKLKLSEEKYRDLFESSPLPKCIFDIETLYFLEANQAALKLYGYSKEEFLSMNLYDIRPREYANVIHGIRSTFEKDTYVVDSVHQKKTGELIQVTITSRAITYNNATARQVEIMDRTEEERTKEELIKTTQQLRDLASHLQDIREQERTSIAREIHDELGQQLTGLKMDISWLNRKLAMENDAIRNRIKSLLELIDITINTVRKIAAQLRPSILDHLGLAEAIRWQSNDISSRTGLQITFDTDVQEAKFPPSISIALFRIFQECLTNVVRHANATEVHASLKMENHALLLTIADNGSGFNTSMPQGERKSLGLLGMKERVTMLYGKYTIESEPGKGTLVMVQIPLSQ